MKTKSLMLRGLLLLLVLCCFSASAEGLSLPADTLVIEQEAFLNCTSLTGALVIPNGVTQISPSAFASSTAEMTLPLWFTA